MSTQCQAMGFLLCFNLLLKNLRRFHKCIKRTLLRLKNLPLRSQKNTLEYTTVTWNYTAFVLPFIMSLFDFITPVMLSNAACVCLRVCTQTSRDIHQCRFYVGGLRNILCLPAETATRLCSKSYHWAPAGWRQNKRKHSR